jgi:pimeloyl-ACP methyl ester carboxylesterase
LENENATNVSRRPGRLKRFIRRTLLGLLLLVIVALLLGASYQWIGNGTDAKRFPQQGKSISLGPEFGDVALNLDCQGQASPTVVLDSGLGVPGIGWERVQKEAAKFARVCWYDRAGYGWSDGSSVPRTSLQIAKELHALLLAAGEKGPFVLAGHSFGGYNVRVYNGQYPSEVVGMVLVDASHEDQESREPPAMQAMMKKYEASLKNQEMLAPFLIRFGVARFQQRNQSQGPGVVRYGADHRVAIWARARIFVRAVRVVASEMTLFSPESASEVRAAGNLGDKPLIVLTAGKNVDASQLPAEVPKKEMDDFHAIWMNELQVKEAHLSTRGKQVIVPDSDHMIPFERPDAIVEALREVCAAVNAGKSSEAAATGSH